MQPVSFDTYLLQPQHLESLIREWRIGGGRMVGKIFSNKPRSSAREPASNPLSPSRRRLPD